MTSGDIVAHKTAPTFSNFRSKTNCWLQIFNLLVVKQVPLKIVPFVLLNICESAKFFTVTSVFHRNIPGPQQTATDYIVNSFAAKTFLPLNLFTRA